MKEIFLGNKLEQSFNEAGASATAEVPKAGMVSTSEHLHNATPAEGLVHTNLNDIIVGLRAKNIKITPQRLQIIGAIMQHKHANIDNIHEIIKQTNPSMSLATIYKNIKVLVQENVIIEIAFADNKTRYELVPYVQHGHMMCKLCGDISDVHINFKDLTVKTMHKDSIIDEIQINVIGTCSNCNTVN